MNDKMNLPLTQLFNPSSIGNAVLALRLPDKMMRYLATLLCLLLSLSTSAEARFNFTDHMGKKLTLSDYKGKWVLINFWPTWCPPCMKQNS